MDSSKPIICTLTPAQRIARGTTWRDVMREAVTNVEECPAGFVLTLGGATIDVDTIRELVEAERDCCRWMDLQFGHGDVLTLTITSSSPIGKAAIQQMLTL